MLSHRNWIKKMDIAVYVNNLRSENYVIDPDEILDLINRLHREWPANAYRGEMVAALFSTLDEWLSQGGYPPKRWNWNPLFKDVPR